MKLMVQNTGSENSWYVHAQGKPNSYWFVHRIGGFQLNVMSVYTRGEGFLRKTCYRNLDSGATRAKVLAAVFAGK